MGDDQCGEAALQYAKRGWYVLPLHGIAGNDCTCPRSSKTRDKETGRCWVAGKHPRTARGVHDATISEDTIRAWWQRWPDANVAIATGRVSDLVVLDIDPRNGGDDTFEALEKQLGKLPDTMAVETGGGGRHLYFCAPGNLALRATLGAGIDVKYDNGYVVGPPSRHVSGERYTWLAECSPDEVGP